MSNKSVFGLDEKVSGCLCYALMCVSGIFYLVMEKENKLVRFHALQSVVWFLLLAVVNFVLGFFVWVPILGALVGIISWLLGLLCFASWIYLMVMAFKGATFKIPILGDAVWNQINK